MATQTTDGMPNRLEIVSGAGYPPLTVDREQNGGLTFGPMTNGAAVSKADVKALAKFAVSDWVDAEAEAKAQAKADADALALAQAKAGE